MQMNTTKNTSACIQSVLEGSALSPIQECGVQGILIALTEMGESPSKSLLQAPIFFCQRDMGEGASVRINPHRNAGSEKAVHRVIRVGFE